MKTYEKRAVPVILSLFIIIIWGCSTNSPKEQLQHITGYWEIEKAKLPDGQVKEYTVNTTVDYIEITGDSTGFRKKLQPRPDGSFSTSGDREAFTISTKDNGLFLNYHTPLSAWEEKVIKVTKDRLILRNTDNLKYFYKRFRPIDPDSLN